MREIDVPWCAVASRGFRKVGGGDHGPGRAAPAHRRRAVDTDADDVREEEGWWQEGCCSVPKSSRRWRRECDVFEFRAGKDKKGGKKGGKGKGKGGGKKEKGAKKGKGGKGDKGAAKGKAKGAKAKGGGDGKKKKGKGKGKKKK